MNVQNKMREMLSIQQSTIDEKNKKIRTRAIENPDKAKPQLMIVPAFESAIPDRACRMRLNNKIRVVAILGCLAQSPLALAQDTDASPTQVSVGLKVWHSSWLSYLAGAYTGIPPAGTPGLADSIDAVEGSQETDVLPTIGVRYNKFSEYAAEIKHLRQLKFALPEQQKSPASGGRQVHALPRLSKISFRR